MAAIIPEILGSHNRRKKDIRSATSTQGLGFGLLQRHLLPFRPKQCEGRFAELDAGVGRIPLEEGAFNRCERSADRLA
jgi:hypothetical protein